MLISHVFMAKKLSLLKLFLKLQSFFMKGFGHKLTYFFFHDLLCAFWNVNTRWQWTIETYLTIFQWKHWLLTELNTSIKFTSKFRLESSSAMKEDFGPAFSGKTSTKYLIGWKYLFQFQLAWKTAVQVCKFSLG